MERTPAFVTLAVYVYDGKTVKDKREKYP